MIDFGISKFSGDALKLTQEQAALGSPLYMSPEAMKSSRDVDARTDLWALGVVLYELTAGPGKTPFYAERVQELCARVWFDEATPLSNHRTDLPAGFERVVMRCLEKDPDKRFGSVAQLAAALAPYAPPQRPATYGVGAARGDAEKTRGHSRQGPSPKYRQARRSGARPEAWGARSRPRWRWPRRRSHRSSAGAGRWPGSRSRRRRRWWGSDCSSWGARAARRRRGPGHGSDGNQRPQPPAAPPPEPDASADAGPTAEPIARAEPTAAPCRDGRSPAVEKAPSRRAPSLPRPPCSRWSH